MIQVVTTQDLDKTEQRIKEDFDHKLRMILEILKEGPTLTIERCEKIMQVERRTVLKRLRQAGIKMNEDVRPVIVETESFYEALWSGRIKS